MMIELLHGTWQEMLPTIRTGEVDCVLADLPYGEIAQGWDVMPDLPALWDELLRVGKPDCQYLFFASFKHAAALYVSQPKLFRYDLVWMKNLAVGFLDAKKKPLRKHEFVLLFARNLGTYNPQFTTGVPIKHKVCRHGTKAGRVYGSEADVNIYQNPEGRRYPVSLQQWNQDPSRHNSQKDNKARHPTQKPLTALEWLVKTYTNPGDTVLDPTMGSGTTGVACQALGRNFIGIEQDEKYAQLARHRIFGEAEPELYPAERTAGEAIIQQPAQARLF